MKNVSIARWFVITILAVLCVLSFISGVTLIVTSSGAASSHDVELQSRRADCRSAYNSEFNEKIRIRDALVAQGLVAAALGDRAALARIGQQVEVANDVVLALPKLNDAVDNGFTLDGVKHPPCPGAT